MEIINGIHLETKRIEVKTEATFYCSFCLDVEMKCASLFRGQVFNALGNLWPRSGKMKTQRTFNWKKLFLFISRSRLLLSEWYRRVWCWANLVRITKEKKKFKKRSISVTSQLTATGISWQITFMQRKIFQLSTRPPAMTTRMARFHSTTLTMLQQSQTSTEHTMARKYFPVSRPRLKDCACDWKMLSANKAARFALALIY